MYEKQLERIISKKQESELRLEQIQQEKEQINQNFKHLTEKYQDLTVQMNKLVFINKRQNHLKNIMSNEGKDIIPKPKLDKLDTTVVYLDIMDPVKLIFQQRTEKNTNEEEDSRRANSLRTTA